MIFTFSKNNQIISIPGVVARTIIRTYRRSVHTCIRAAAFRLPTTIFAEHEVFIAVRVGAVDHVGRWRTTYPAFGDDGWVHGIDWHRYPLVKYIAIAFKILASHFFAVFDDTAMELVYLFETCIE